MENESKPQIESNQRPVVPLGATRIGNVTFTDISVDKEALDRVTWSGLSSALPISIRDNLQVTFGWVAGEAGFIGSSDPGHVEASIRKVWIRDATTLTVGANIGSNHS